MKEELKNRVLYLLKYTDALLNKMDSEAVRINNNVRLMVENVRNGVNVDEALNEYKYDRVYYNLYEGEIVKSFGCLFELYTLALSQGVGFEKKDKERLDLLVQQEEERQFFAFQNNEIVPKSEEVVKLIKERIAQQDGKGFKEQFIKDATENYDKILSQAKEFGHDFKPSELEYVSIEEPAVDVEAEEVIEKTT